MSDLEDLLQKRKDLKAELAHLKLQLESTPLTMRDRTALVAQVTNLTFELVDTENLIIILAEDH